MVTSSSTRYSSSVADGSPRLFAMYFGRVVVPLIRAEALRLGLFLYFFLRRFERPGGEFLHRRGRDGGGCAGGGDRFPALELGFELRLDPREVIQVVLREL